MQLREGGMWSNPGVIDGKGTKRPPQKDLYNSRHDGSSGAGAMGGSAAQAPPMPMPKKTMKKK